MVTVLLALRAAVVALSLLVNASVVYSDAKAVDLLRASYSAARAAPRGVPAELLLAITEHESDLDPCAVSYVGVDGRRHDLRHACDGAAVPWQVFGYLQAMGNRATAAREMQLDGGMSAGVGELEEWARTCQTWGDRGVECVLRGHAGGTACAKTGACTPAQHAFVRLFVERAHLLRGLAASPRA